MDSETNPVNAIIKIVKDLRRDAENVERDSSASFEVVRVWLRTLHMEIVCEINFGNPRHFWGRDTPQDEIAALLGEHPRGHERAFKVI